MDRKTKMHKKKAAVEAETAADKASAAVDHAAAAMSSAAAALGAALTNAQEKAGPAAKVALARGLEAAEQARTAVEPKLSGAYGMVSPGVDSARQRVTEELIPRLQEMLHEAEGNPTLQEASKRGTAALAALKGEVEVAEPALPAKKKKSVGKTLAKIAAASALLAGAAVAVRQFLLSKDDGWTAHEPSPAYTADTRTPDSKLVYTTETTTDEVTEEVPVSGDVTVEGDPVSDMTDEGGLPNDGAAEQPLSGPYGEGAYVGDEPPADHTIKGNERSKKYHTPDSAGYERTIADVWFQSEDAARAAGFSKAQR